MKRFSRAAALAFPLSVLAAGASHASNAGGLAWPVGPGGFASSVTIAYAEQDLEDSGETVSTFRNLLRAQFGLLDDLDVYGAVGTSDLEVSDSDEGGGRGFTFGGGIHYSMVRAADASIRLMLNLEAEWLNVDGVKRDAYQAGVYVVKQYGAAGTTGYFFPYAGARVSYSRYRGGDFDDTDPGNDTDKAENFIGFFAGADYFVSPNVFFSGEVHLFDEMSVYGTAGYRF